MSSLPIPAPPTIDPSSEALTEFANEIHAQKRLRDQINLAINNKIYAYIKLNASAPTEIDKAIANLREYVHKFYPTNPESAEPFFASLKENLTMAPISFHFTICRYGPYAEDYDTILYEWRGRRVMYVRTRERQKPSKKNEANFKRYTELNGFSFDGFRLSKSDDKDRQFSLAKCDDMPNDFYRTWWKSDIIPDSKVRDEIELRIDASHKSKSCWCGFGHSCDDCASPPPLDTTRCVPFSARIDGIPPTLQLVVAAFDQTCYSHYVITDFVLRHASEFTPYADDTESQMGYDEEDDADAGEDEEDDATAESE